MKQFDIIKEQINRVIDQKTQEEWVESVGTLLQKAIDASGSRFVSGEDVPKIFEAECAQLAPAFEECLSRPCRQKVIDLWEDSESDEIASILYSPVVHPKTDECLGVILFRGRAAYEQEVEEMVPLKSGSKTIGVTVKKKRVEIPDRIFTYDDLYLVAQSYIYMFDRIEMKEREELLALPEKKEPSEETSEERSDTRQPEKSERKKKGILETIKRLIIPGKDPH